MAKTGRPKKEIDQKIFENLCAIQCTQTEICGIFDCCEDTLNAWCKRTYKDEHGKGLTFSEAYKKKSLGGKASLRRYQFRLAEKNATMAIFLGKQYLGQSDQPAAEQGSRDDNNLLDAIRAVEEVDTDDLPEVE